MGLGFSKRFDINYVVENGEVHCVITDLITNKTLHCDCNEVNETIWELLGM